MCDQSTFFPLKLLRSIKRERERERADPWLNHLSHLKVKDRSQMHLLTSYWVVELLTLFYLFVCN